MEPLADLTGVLKKELQALVLYPLAMGVSISAAVLWVLLSVRQFIIKKMRQPGGRSVRSTAGDAGRRVGASWFLTVALRANLLLEAIVPVFLPIIVAHIAIEQQALKELVHPVLVISKPGQRLALGIIVLGALVLSFVLSRLLVAVDSWSSSSGRKPNEKKLH
uniref:Uncharacterized protein TCIL3000_10_4560 n=1 Tax=Trypanosoma congolense (strain IL3000) TaxID=1068625 RepID=G0UWC7_TRYCI|nr:unnamed protein product [Trypanosoma congolense IL3000]